MTNKIYSRIEHTVDHATGQVTETNTIAIRKVENEPDFVKMYLQDIGRLQDLTEKEMSVLCEVLRLMDYDNKVRLVAGTKKDICTRLKMFQVESETPSVNSFNVIVSRLVNKGVIIRDGTGQYVVDPALFGKGKWTDIRTIRLRVSYDKEGRKIEANIGKQ